MIECDCRMGLIIMGRYEGTYVRRSTVDRYEGEMIIWNKYCPECGKKI